MPTYNYIHEAKIVTWERTEFFIEADSQTEADERAKEFIGYDIDEDGDEVYIKEVNIDFIANQLISVEDNNGHPTVKVFRDDGKVLLATNLPDDL